MFLTSIGCRRHRTFRASNEEIKPMCVLYFGRVPEMFLAYGPHSKIYKGKEGGGDGTVGGKEEGGEMEGLEGR